MALRHARKNPVRALLMTLGTPALPDAPGMSVGTPITDNALTVFLEGRAGYSIGHPAAKTDEYCDVRACKRRRDQVATLRAHLASHPATATGNIPLTDSPSIWSGFG